MKTCDIIIPTYNSAKVLPKTLSTLKKQYISNGWSPRLVICDDGSSDDTIRIAKNAQLGTRWRPISVLAGTHEGIAQSRNRGLKNTTADVIMFLGSDIILRPRAMNEHLIFHDQHPENTSAALGVIKWDPRINPTPFMEWMMHGGQQNNFDALLGTTSADPKHFFYGAFISIKGNMIQGKQFPEIYKGYGWEDIDLGRQLAKDGVTLTVLHKALALHHHTYTADDIFRRQYYTGRGVLMYKERYPEGTKEVHLHAKRRLKLHIARISGVRVIMRWIVRNVAHKYCFPRLFLAITAMEYWYGTWKS